MASPLSALHIKASDSCKIQVLSRYAIIRKIFLSVHEEVSPVNTYDLLAKTNFFTRFEFTEGIWNVKKNHIPDFGFLR